MKSKPHESLCWIKASVRDSDLNKAFMKILNEAEPYYVTSNKEGPSKPKLLAGFIKSNKDGE